MSSSQGEELSAGELSLLDAIYVHFSETALWPPFLHVRYGLTQPDPSRLYERAFNRGLVQPPLPADAGLWQQDATEVMLTLEGLASVSFAQEDVQRMLEAVRFVAATAASLSPRPPASVVLALDSEQMASALKLPATDLSIRRIGPLLSMIPNFWITYGGTPGGQWRLTVSPETAREYAAVVSINDLISRISALPESSAAAASTREANPQTSVERREQLSFGRNVASDLPTKVDRLGFKPVVRALHGLLNDRNTSLPLTIAIAAPWGAGKSSVMEQLRGELAKSSHEDYQREWTTVRFDAWKYERSERLWAALAKAIYTQSQEQMKPWTRLRFRVTLEFRRRGWLGFCLAAAWPVAVLSALAVSVAEIGLSKPGAIPAILAVSAFLLAAATRFGNAFVNPFRAAIERHACKPDYEEQLGFTTEADHDISILTKLIAPSARHGLAVFVDDLDRCSHTHMVEVVEAMNQIFNSANDHQCLFVLGLDRDVVATNIEVAYGPTVEKLSQHDSSRHFGFEFLAKLVQLSVALPMPSPEALAALAQELGGKAMPAPAPGGQRKATTQMEIGQHGSPSDPDPPAVRPLSPPTPPQRKAERLTRRLSASMAIQDSPRVAAAMAAIVPFLERNPRQIKRFHNAFRLQMYVASEDERVRFDFSEAELEALARWVAMRLRWPQLGDAVVREPTLLKQMEMHANEEQPIGDLGPAKTVSDWLSQPDLKALLTSDADLRISSLDVKAFLRVV